MLDNSMFRKWLETFDYETNPVVPKLIQSRLDQKSGYKVVVVGVNKFDGEWSKDTGMYLPPGGRGENYIAIQGLKDKPADYNRYDRVGEEAPKFKEKGMPFEMPTVGLRFGTPSFTDGRHRFAYLRDQGVKFLPISVHKENYREIKKRFGVE
jgi:hypothetical protein